MSRLKPGDLQLAILTVLWEQGEATTARFHEALTERKLALTTIATMLRKMDDRGLVRHRREGRALVYSAAVDESEVRRSMVDDVVDRLFSGDPSSLVHHLVSEGEIDLDELDALRQRVQAARSARDGGNS
ncbi:MAG: BlaI/MecI/CopY family transcriptional regulator [Planctomycetota bacterium]